MSERPGIAKACFLIAVDNGGINRARSTKQQAKAFDAWIARQGFPNLEEIDNWLSALSEEELDIFCCGGSDEPEVQDLRSKAPVFTDDLLNAYFEEVC